MVGVPNRPPKNVHGNLKRNRNFAQPIGGPIRCSGCYGLFGFGALARVARTVKTAQASISAVRASLPGSETDLTRLRLLIDDPQSATTALKAIELIEERRG